MFYKSVNCLLHSIVHDLLGYYSEHCNATEDHELQEQLLHGGNAFEVTITNCCHRGSHEVDCVYIVVIHFLHEFKSVTMILHRLFYAIFPTFKFAIMLFWVKMKRNPKARTHVDEKETLKAWYENVLKVLNLDSIHEVPLLTELDYYHSWCEYLVNHRNSE